jgi:ATP-dependent exoDNAse (exonuclease V) beta subunit
MVERFAEAVLDDGLAVSAILAITFTEKAAAELRDRVRRRFAERGEEEHARAVDAAWIGTIHGFCARVLRGRALAAGLDPRFTVLDEPAATRLADAAFAEALETWMASGGAPALDLAAAYGPNLRPAVLATHAALRSRGQSRPALPDVPAGAAPDRAGLEAALVSARAALSSMKDGKRVTAGLLALDACAAVLERGAIPSPGDLDAALLRGGKPLDTEPCDAYREALTAFRAACAGHHARAALVPLDALLRAYDAAYRDAKAQRFAVDFADLELHVRDLLEADPAVRRRLAERFGLIMVDEFQDTNRVQLDLLEHLERDNLFAVGDEFQAIYGFRHADVTLFRERRGALGPQRARRLTANFRSVEPVLDVINGAFSPLWPSFAPLVAGTGRRPEACRRPQPQVAEQPAEAAPRGETTACCGSSIPTSRSPGSRRSERRAARHGMRGLRGCAHG